MIDEKKHIEDLEELKKYRQLGTVEELAKRIPEEKVLKFYYCESLDKYLVGIRCGTMYYAELTENHCLCMIMSRYLPWGKHIVDETTLWKEHTYPSEPKEIPFDEWLRGYINQQPKLDVPDNNVGKWIPFKLRKADEEEREVYGYDAMLDCKLPDEDEEILITNKYGHVYMDIFCSDYSECYLESGNEFVTEAVAWMPLPPAYKGE